MKKLIAFVLVALFPSMVFAQDLSELGAQAGQIVEHMNNGQLLLGLMLGLMAAVTIVRKIASKVKFLSFFTTQAGGYLLTYGGSIAGSIVTAKQAGIPISLKLILGALAAGFTASGGWEAFSDALAWLQKKFGK